MSTESFKWGIESFDDAIEYIADLIGSDFKKCIELTYRIIENPDDFTGPAAKLAVIRLAGYRVLVGQAAQYMKKQSVASKKPHDQLKKDALMCMYDSLLELINTLKVAIKYEKEVIG